MLPEDTIRTLADRVRHATRITVLTGAGVSAASGVPTFRGPEGLWKQYRPEQLATPQAFASDPRLVWEWYNWRRERVAACQPNRAHDVLARWSRQCPGFALITQNVDGLHERAGTKDVIRFHGSIWELRCWQGCNGGVAWQDETVPLPELPVCCRHCGGLARPAVVWFGEPIDPSVLARCRQALDCDLFMTIGTSAVVYPAAALIGDARARGAYTVEINAETTPASTVVDLAIQDRAEFVLDRVERELTGG